MVRLGQMEQACSHTHMHESLRSEIFSIRGHRTATSHSDSLIGAYPLPLRSFVYDDSLSLFKHDYLV